MKSKVFLYNNHGSSKKVFNLIAAEKNDYIYIEKINLYLYDLSVLKYDGLVLRILDQYEYFYKSNISQN